MGNRKDNHSAPMAIDHGSEANKSLRVFAVAKSAIGTAFVLTAVIAHKMVGLLLPELSGYSRGIIELLPIVVVVALLLTWFTLDKKRKNASLYMPKIIAKSRLKSRLYFIHLPFIFPVFLLFSINSFFPFEEHSLLFFIVLWIALDHLANEFVAWVVAR